MNGYPSLKFAIPMLIGVFCCVVFGIWFYGEYVASPQNHNELIKPSHNEIDYSIVGESLIVRGISQARTSGISMQPSIHTGNTLILKEYDSDNALVEGMIVVTNKGISHRIIGSYYPNFVYLKGDSVSDIDKVKIEDIDYVVIGVLYT